MISVIKLQDEPVTLHRGPLSFAAAVQGLQVARFMLLCLSRRTPFVIVGLMAQAVLSLDEECLWLFTVEHGRATA